MSITKAVKESFEFSLGHDLFLRGDVHALPSAERKPVLLICHGFKGFKDWGFFPYIANKLAEKGFIAITFNFSCNGVHRQDFDELDKFAVNTYSREQADLDFLHQKIKTGSLPFHDQFDTDQIGLLGHSRGGGNSLIFAAEHPDIKAVVTWNGIANVDLFDEKLKSEIENNGVGYIVNARTKQNMPIRAAVIEDLKQNNQRFDIPSRLTELTIPVLLIQGSADAPRLVEGSEKLKAAAPHQTLMIIPGGNHTFGSVHPFQGPTPDLETVLEDTISFFRRTLG